MSDYVRKSGERISLETRQLISYRYRVVTRALNREFYNIDSETKHSYYVGSYGRGTAIDSSDVDILFEMPDSEFSRFNNPYSNGQSYLLQVVKNAILTSYPRSDVRGDGQVVVIDFSDGIRFEILPAFIELDWLGNKKYKYPHTHDGGSWLSTNPLKEQEAMKEKNRTSNGLLYDTCKHIRFIRDNYFRSYKLSGIVIDSFVYSKMEGWRWNNPDSLGGNAAPGEYEKHLLEKAEELKVYSIYGFNNSLKAPGSNDDVDFSKSIDCLIKVLTKIVG